MALGFRQARRLIVLVSVGLLLFVVGFAIYAWEINYRGNLAVREIQGELSDRGILDLYPQYLKEHDDWHQTNPWTSAAYWRAAMESVPNEGELPLLSAGVVPVNDIEPRQQFHPDMVAALRQIFESEPVFLDLIESAKQAPYGSYGLMLDYSNPEERIEVLGQSRSIARWLEERSRLAQIDNDSDAYTDSIESIFAVSEQLGKEQMMISGLVSGSIDALARYAIGDGLSRIELSEQQLNRLIGIMNQRRASVDLEAMFGFEMSWQYHVISSNVQAYIRLNEAKQRVRGKQLVMLHPEWFEREVPALWYEAFWQDLLLSACPGRYELRDANYMRAYLADYDQLQKLNGSPQKRWAWLQKRDKELEALSDEMDIDWSDPRSMHNGWPITTARTFTLMDSNLATMITALHVEKYRVINGHWPKALKDAIGTNPIDGFGEFIRYRINKEGVMIYTVGFNTIDEQGYGQHDDDVPTQFVDPDDWAIRLYNPELRNTIPPPDEAIDPDYDGSWKE